jgi:HAD superfamily hydrolase (TIGR01509 family)
MTRTVVWDFGAVLFRWQPVELLQQIVPEHAADADAARSLAAQIFQSFTPESDWARFDLGLLTEEPLAQRIAARTGVPAAAVRRVIDAVPWHLEAQAETVEVLRAVKAAGHRTVFLSNMPRPYAHHLERHNPFIAEFDDGIYSGRVGLVKPWPAIFELAAHRFGFGHDADVVFIDDHAGNVEAGRAQGWQGLRFESAAQVRHSLSGLGLVA